MYKVQFRQVINDAVVSPWCDYPDMPVKMDTEELISACELFYSRNWNAEVELIPVGWGSNLFEMKVTTRNGTTHRQDWQFRVVPVTVEDGGYGYVERRIA